MRMCGVYLNRARVAAFGLFIPIMIMILLAEDILVGLGQDAEVCGYM